LIARSKLIGIMDLRLPVPKGRTGKTIVLRDEFVCQADLVEPPWCRE
jgi:hypothetical protein